MIYNQSSREANPIIIGAGIGGLAAALRLAVAGVKPIVLERSETVGGKAHQVSVIGPDDQGSERSYMVSSGPTVMTMIPVFEELFQLAGAKLSERLKLTRAETLARHFWADGSMFDLPANWEEAVEAVRAFAGDQEADGFVRYHRYTETIYESVKDIFIYAPKPTPLEMIRRLGVSMLPRLIRADIHRVMWSSLQRYFKDDRLKQLFGRYATYAGNNPFMTPATFNLIASVEQRGVWRVEGGISALAEAMRELIVQLGGEVIVGAEVSEIQMSSGQVSGVRLTDGRAFSSEIVIFNGDTQAITGGHLGDSVKNAVPAYHPNERSLSALTCCAVINATEAPLLHHNVWFSDDYHREFKELEEGRLPSDPTIYLCAQDRADDADVSSAHSLRHERIFSLINAPAKADVSPLSSEEITQCQTTVTQRLKTYGLSLSPSASAWMSPQEWSHRCPHSGGAIYGMASRRWNSTLKRAGAKSRVRGLYLAGGSTHPGAGVPMAAISGKIAANQVINDYTLTDR